MAGVNSSYTRNYEVYVGIKIYKNGQKSPIKVSTVKQRFHTNNEHEDYNAKFECINYDKVNSKCLRSYWNYKSQYNGTHNPYSISTEVKNHIKLRHDLNYLNPHQFIKAYISKFADNPADREKVLKEFTKRGGSSETYKGSCWNQDDMKNNESKMFQSFIDVAEMTNIKDHWKGSNDNSLIVAGTRKIVGHEHIINSLVARYNGQYSFGNDKFGTAFPDDSSSRDLNITNSKNEVEEAVKLLSESELEERFGNYVSLGSKEPNSIKESFKGIFKEPKTKNYDQIKLKGGKRIISDSPTSGAIYHKTLDLNGKSISLPRNKW